MVVEVEREHVEQTIQPDMTIEEALARAEADADTALRAAAGVQTVLKAYRAAARQGRLRELRASAERARLAIQTLDREIQRLATSWDFDEEEYFSSGAYTRELIERAQQSGLRISELDNRLYSYPALIRILPGERAVTIDKARERRLRPSVLVGILSDLQKRPPRSRSADFLEALYSAYQIALPHRKGRAPGTVVPLIELYELFTLAPGQAREYSRQEFTRDVYLLDQSGVATTKDGARVEFHGGAGARMPRGTLSIVTQQGAERKYHGVAFVATDTETP